MATPVQRALRLLSLLQSGRRWTGEDLARALEVPGRTLRRDLDLLREIGYPVRSTRGPGGYYQLVAGAALPPLMLDDDEAIAIALGLRWAAAGGTGVETVTESAQRAGDKLRRVLPSALRHRTEQVLAAVEFAHTAPPQTDNAVLRSLATAISEHAPATFDYQGKAGSSRRTVEPMRMVQIRGRWYLYAWDRDRHDWRNFRVDRVGTPHVEAERFTPRALPTDDLARHLQHRFRGPRTVRIVLTLNADARDAAGRLHRIDGELEPIDDHHCRYTAYVDSFEWITVVLAATDIEFTIDEPTEYRYFLNLTAQRLLRAV
ncbi:helix-turn-helix transcriptional regulator [Kitasatospora sp. NPDC048407]|uniref:helix-turn-helix transcriptional regulator n=1 Tax=Kitasatospora sp. NPDC048407 TaxID=3364051 RepID=UPI0037121E03